jgi:hypothetical protein
MLRVREREATLLDLLDRLLDKGVVVAGDLTLSVAEVDLIFASLRLVVTSADKIWEVQGRPSPDWGPPASPGNGGSPGAGSGPPRDPIGKAMLPPPRREQEVSPEFTSSPSGGEDIDPDKAANGLAQLVLTLVELIRRLLERETLRRMERGTLTPQETERLGQAFVRMEQKMQEIKKFFDLEDKDLNLDLGPLGKLM